MFADRRDAGLQLAEKLKHYKSCKGLIVLALPRGGAVTGFEIARTIGAPLDVLIVRKIGFPGQLELAVGAVSETGTIVLNQHIISDGGVSQKYIEDEIAAQKKELINYWHKIKTAGPEPPLEKFTLCLMLNV